MLHFHGCRYFKVTCTQFFFPLPGIQNRVQWSSSAKWDANTLLLSSRLLTSKPGRKIKTVWSLSLTHGVTLKPWRVWSSKNKIQRSQCAASQVRWNGSSFEQKTKELISTRRQHLRLLRVCNCSKRSVKIHPTPKKLYAWSLFALRSGLSLL